MQPRLVLFLVVLAFGATAAQAGHPAATDDAGTVDAGSYELELSGSHLDARDVQCQGYGLALRRGLSGALDVGAAAACVQDDGSTWELAVDAKVRLGHEQGLRPATFVRFDAAVVDLAGTSDPTWNGLALGGTWGFGPGELTIEFVGVGAERSREPIGLGVVWYESLGAHWTLALEATTEPFVARPASTVLIGLVHHLDMIGDLSVGMRAVDAATSSWDDVEWSLGLTRGFEAFD